MNDSKGKTGFFADFARLLRLLAQSWRSAGISTRRISVVMWCVGLVLIVVGVGGDLRGAWSSVPFVTNLLTSVTAFFFAVPVALLILHDVSHRMTERAERRAAIALFSESVKQLQEFVCRLPPAETPFSPASDDPPLKKFLDAARFRAAGMPETTGPEAAQALQEAIDQWRHDPVHVGFAEYVGEVRRELIRLRDVVRPRFVQLDLGWSLDTLLEDLLPLAERMLRRLRHTDWSNDAEPYIQLLAERTNVLPSTQALPVSLSCSERR